jgi:UDP-2,3-diacylglucosamine hydrolase
VSEIYVISDQHFEGEEEKAIQPFLSLCEHLEQNARQVERLIVLGDFFQYWFNGRQFILDRYEKVLEGLKQVSKAGIPIDFFLGNHDFLFRSYRDKPARMTIHSKGEVLPFGRGSYYITHGDDLCRSDYGYLLMTPVLRSRVLEVLFSLLPDAAIEKIAALLSRTSRKIVKRRNPKTLRITPSYCRQLIRRHEADGIVHGHFHENGLSTFDVDGIPATSVSVGPWERGQCPVWIFDTELEQWREEDWQEV